MYFRRITRYDAAVVVLRGRDAIGIDGLWIDVGYLEDRDKAEELLQEKEIEA
ncbi:hypothetical protein [Halobaculum saliterrae]|uniref:hypothetical protein n=1 Tax=Halobaculum saliterrae TaxID=2073113 RepID=UPI001915F6A2|nr:hypothetical protein [Halobaculum saliterrae]